MPPNYAFEGGRGAIAALRLQRVRVVHAVQVTVAHVTLCARLAA